MSNKRIVVLVVAAALLIGGVALAVALRDQPTANGGGPAALPEATEEDTSTSTTDSATIEPEGDVDAPPGPVDAAVSATDPVPDALVQVFFGMIEDAGATPLMNETYTVEFVDTTDKVHIEGRFEEGSKEFEFEFKEGAWKLETNL